MGKLAQQLGGQSQVKVFKNGGAVKTNGGKKAANKKCACGGMVKGGKK